ncbi:MAG TPA: 1,4-dihydroxy-6-naphthoate synthase [Planctomycetota bacterium]|nr:1,4-dihydroxy-6-naphthoate synthase [Planctomycetota bacterium]
MRTDESSSAELEVGYSPCPNDTFIFHALVTGRVASGGFTWRPRIEDVETLNQWAFTQRLPVTKISFHAYGRIRREYALLRSGAALGRGCGPLVVAREPRVMDDLTARRIAIPGHWTSAALLLRLFCPALPRERLVVLPFDRILEATARGEVDAGLIIHESRFCYAQRGLVALVDLGEWWEGETGQPIPLGGIIARRDLGAAKLRAIEEGLRASVRFARGAPAESAEYVRRHAQELSSDVIAAHIGLYVNDFTEDLGTEGLAAVEGLFRTAEERGILEAYRGPLTA